MHKWQVSKVFNKKTLGGTIHVWPLGDTREHTTTKCWCKPAIEDNLIIHNAADGREAYEDGLRKPN